MADYCYPIFSYILAGQTAEKTNDRIDEARGSTLLIDEAYQLTSLGGEKDFGIEAFNTIMQSIEGGHTTTSNRPAYIFAGYPEEMIDFVAANEGMGRRITKTFDFPDYTHRELASILTKMAKQQCFTITMDIAELTDLLAERF